METVVGSAAGDRGWEELGTGELGTGESGSGESADMAGLATGSRS
jgi:hypothetical protein